VFLLNGERLKQLRKEKNLTQSELGNKINVTKVSISGYESGNRTPDTDTLQRIADFFEVSTDYLLGRTESPSYSQEENDEAEFQAFANDPELKRWYRELPQSKEEDLQMLRKMWEVIKKETK